MFTGIIETTGHVAVLEPTPDGQRLTIDISRLDAAVRAGDSIAINGVCLTAVGPTSDTCAFDVIPETLRRTALSDFRPGARVNLEQAMAAGQRFDGHFVQGHVDAVGTVSRIDRQAGEYILWLEHGPDIRDLIIPKGSITIDGVSLTIADVNQNAFGVALIPTTLERTTLSELQPGRRVNLETDVIARAVAHQLSLYRAGRGETANHGTPHNANTGPRMLDELLHEEGFA